MTTMASQEISKIHCLFHQKIECSCIYPVSNNPSLVERLKHHIRLNGILNKHETDAEKKQKRDEETILYEARLSDLK